MANLIVDIGNTALKAAWSENITLGKTFRYQGERIMDFIFSLTDRIKPEIMVISSVRDITASDRENLKKECGRLVVMDSNSGGDVMKHYGLPAYITSDRAASIQAARYLFKGRGCTVFDFGTTLTIDFIDRGGNYGGGNISLGCRTRFKAVSRYSKNLPLLDTPDFIEDAGYSVTNSIASGIISGIMFEIEGYLNKYPENIVVFTGGDAIYFAKRMKNSIFVVCNLVLMGLAIIADDYEKGKL